MFDVEKLVSHETEASLLAHKTDRGFLTNQSARSIQVFFLNDRAKLFATYCMEYGNLSLSLDNYCIYSINRPKTTNKRPS